MFLNKWNGQFVYLDENDGEGNDLGGGEGEDNTDENGEGEGEGQAAAAEGSKGEGKKDPEGEGEGEGEGEDESKGHSHMVPKSRMDTISRREKKAAARVAELEAQLAEKPKTTTTEETSDWNSKFAALDKRQADALADGDRDALAGILAEQRTLTNEYNSEVIANSSAATTTNAQNGIRYDAYLASLEATYPAIDPDNEAYDEATHDEVSDVMNAFLATGDYAPAEALERAASYVFNQAVDQPVADPRTTDVDKNLDAHKRTAPNGQGKGGLDNGEAGMKAKVDPMKLSEAEFDRLGEEELSKLRGDTL